MSGDGAGDRNASDGPRALSERPDPDDHNARDPDEHNAGDPDDWSVADTEVVWENPYFAAGYDAVEGPDGAVQRWYWIDPADVVAVVAETDASEVVVVEQYDGRLGRSLLTCPGGGVDDGESFVDAGVRELREETGYRAGEAELVSVYYPTAWARMRQAVVYAGDLTLGAPDRDDGEHLDVYTAAPAAVLDTLESRSPAFGVGLTALLAAREAGLLSFDRS